MINKFQKKNKKTLIYRIFLKYEEKTIYYKIYKEELNDHKSQNK